MWKPVEDAEASGKQWKTVEGAEVVRKQVEDQEGAGRGQEEVRKAQKRSGRLWERTEEVGRLGEVMVKCLLRK